MAMTLFGVFQKVVALCLFVKKHKLVIMAVIVLSLAYRYS